MSQDKDELTDEQRQQYIDIWSKAVDTQMHFNLLQVKARQLGTAFVTTMVGLGILSFGEHSFINTQFSLGFLNVHASLIFVLMAIVALKVVEYLDLDVYHCLLHGAVDFGWRIEKKHLKKDGQGEKS